MTRSGWRAAGWLLAVMGWAGVALAEAPTRVTVFAASSLADVLGDLAAPLLRDARLELRTSTAATSTLAKQVEAGGRADVFFSADETWTDQLEKKGLLVPGTRRALLGNTLVVITPADRAVTLDVTQAGWLERLPPGRIVTGDPAHVPVGRYAHAALTTLGVWDQVVQRLARADNVRAAMVLVERGEAAAGIVYATDARSASKVHVAAQIPTSTHRPIVYDAAVLRGGDAAVGRRLLEALQTPAARAIFEARGFSVY